MDGMLLVFGGVILLCVWCGTAMFRWQVAGTTEKTGHSDVVYRSLNAWVSPVRVVCWCPVVDVDWFDWLIDWLIGWLIGWLID